MHSKMTKEEVEYHLQAAEGFNHFWKQAKDQKDQHAFAELMKNSKNHSQQMVLRYADASLYSCTLADDNHEYNETVYSLSTAEGKYRCHIPERLLPESFLSGSPIDFSTKVSS